MAEAHISNEAERQKKKSCQTDILITIYPQIQLAQGYDNLQLNTLTPNLFITN